MGIFKLLKRESDAISGILIVLLLLILFKYEIITLPEIDLWVFLTIFLSIFGVTFVTLTFFQIIDKRIFEVAEKRGRKRFLERTVKTPLILSFFGLIFSFVFIFFSNYYSFSIIVGVLVYDLLSLIEFFRFIYYIKSEVKEK